MTTLIESLRNGKRLLADGAMGTMLLERGLAAGVCPEALNLERPGLLQEIAGQYLEAGAQILGTNTFGASPLKLAPYSLEHQFVEINECAVRAVREVAGDGAYIAASCGPSGRLLKPHGDTDRDVILDSFGQQLECLIGSGVDAVCIETMTDLLEATLAIEAARQASPTIPIIASMTFEPTPRGYYTIMGVSIEQAAVGLAAAGADIIGSNCGCGSEQMVAIAQELRKHTGLPVIIQSNAGLPEIRDGRLTYNESPAFMADNVAAMLRAGVQIVGGCCGTTPAHIRAFKTVIDRHPPTHTASNQSVGRPS